MNNKFLKTKISFNSLRSENTRNPHKQWSVLVMISILASCILIFISLYLLYQIKNEQMFKQTQINLTNEVILKEDLVKQFDSIVQNKREKQEMLKLNTPTYSDPGV